MNEEWMNEWMYNAPGVNVSGVVGVGVEEFQEKRFEIFRRWIKRGEDGKKTPSKTTTSVSIWYKKWW